MNVAVFYCWLGDGLKGKRLRLKCWEKLWGKELDSIDLIAACRLQGGLGRWKMWDIKQSADQESRSCAPSQQFWLFLASLGSTKIINHLHKQRTELCTSTHALTSDDTFWSPIFSPLIRSWACGCIFDPNPFLLTWALLWMHRSLKLGGGSTLIPLISALP